MMWTRDILFISLFLYVTSEDIQDPVLYYYGLDESERSLPQCAERQACSALLQRYWAAPALVRMCRCARRLRCHAHTDTRIEVNNRAHFQFCKPVNDWPQCSIGDLPLTVNTSYDRLDPNEIENMHHLNVQLTPPKILFKCKCRDPVYWKLNGIKEDIQEFQCASLPLCRTGEFCGNVSDKLYALYQACLCPKRHICVHGGGLPLVDISELLYKGKGWRAYCERVGEEHSYEDY